MHVFEQEKKMQEIVIYSSDYISISKREDGFYIQSLSKGMSLEQFSRLILDHPEMKLTSIMAVRNALVNAPCSPVKFAESIERIMIELSEDELKAYVTLCVDEKELIRSQSADIFKEVICKLKENGIIYGIKNDVLLNKMSNNTKTLVAEGIAPIDGEDSIIRMY